MSHQSNALVVDDDPNILAAFQDFLKREHCSMIAATSSEEALRKLENHSVDFLVTDVRLKLQSGLTFLLNVKTCFPHLPVIVITGYPDLVSEADAMALGADFFFLKPLELNKLRHAIRTCLESSYRHRRSSFINHT